MPNDFYSEDQRALAEFWKRYDAATDFTDRQLLREAIEKQCQAATLRLAADWLRNSPNLTRGA